MKKNKKLTEKQQKLLEDRKSINIGHGKYAVSEQTITIGNFLEDWGHTIIPYEGQRRPGIWPTERKRNFISCLLLGKHFNSVEAVLVKDGAETEDGNLVDRWDIIDGLQRLSTIIEFVDPKRVDMENPDDFEYLVLTNTMAEKYGEPGLKNLKWDLLSPVQQKSFKKINLNFKIHDFGNTDSGVKDLNTYFQNLQQSSILTESEKLHSKYADNNTYMLISNHLLDNSKFRQTFKPLKDKNGKVIRSGLMKEDRGTPLIIGLNLFMLFWEQREMGLSMAEIGNFLGTHVISDDDVKKCCDKILETMKNIKHVMKEEHAYCALTQKGKWRMNGNLVAPLVYQFSKYDFQSQIKGNSIKVDLAIKNAVDEIKNSSNIKGADSNKDRVSSKINIFKKHIDNAI